MTSLSPYLNFDGKTEEAMKLYADVLGGELHMQRFGDMPMPTPPEQKNRIMHATLRSDALTLMASDTPPGQGAPVTGNQAHLCLSFEDKKEMWRVWERLAQGASISAPLKEEFFGSFGVLTDKFGTLWMFHSHGGDTPK
jgi:PhnB protein